jgi:hypothetical protein
MTLLGTWTVSAVATGPTTATLSWSVTGIDSPLRDWNLSAGGPGFPVDSWYAEGVGSASGTMRVGGLTNATSYSWFFDIRCPADQVDSTRLTTNTVTTGSAPVWSDNTLAGFQAGTAYSDAVSATNGPTYSVSAGSLPTGISLNTSTGAITGTPTVGGQSYSFTLRATNGVGFVSQAFSGTVAAPASAGKWRVWTGSAWVVAPLKVWNGSTWVNSSVKVWNGSAWVTSV